MKIKALIYSACALSITSPLLGANEIGKETSHKNAISLKETFNTQELLAQQVDAQRDRNDPVANDPVANMRDSAQEEEDSASASQEDNNSQGEGEEKAVLRKENLEANRRMQSDDNTRNNHRYKNNQSKPSNRQGTARK